MAHNYCTIASKEYIGKVLSLYWSIQQNDYDFNFFIICFDDEVKHLLEKLELDHVNAVAISDIEAGDEELKSVKNGREKKEYAWTAKPSILLFLLNKYEAMDHIIWLDGDTAFLSNPQPIYDEWGSYSILLTEEMYSGKYKFMSWSYGVYNTGLLGFKNDNNSIECLKWLRSKVINWCYDKMEKGLWSDQMYFNDLPERFNNVGVIKNRGINMTPFILWRILDEQNGTVEKREDHVYLHNIKIILFHYYGFKLFNKNEFDLCAYKNWHFPINAIKEIYEPYCAINLRAAELLVKHDKNLFTYTRPVREKCGYYYCTLPERQDQSFNFCTIVTDEYLPKALTLYNSIRRHTEYFHLWICCMSDTVYDILDKLKLENISLVALSEIETHELREVKKYRKDYEYCWTLKAPLVIHLFKKYDNLDSLLYVDADIYLFSNPEKIFAMLKRYSVLLTPHNFSKHFRHLYTKKGRYNAGIIGFKRDANSIKCLHWWKRKCIEWCYETIEKNRFGDQKYLEEFKHKFAGVYFANNTAFNTAIWNIRDAVVKIFRDKILINDERLIFYHFSSFVIFTEDEYDLWKWDYLQLDENIIDNIYITYAKDIYNAIQMIKSVQDDISFLCSGKMASNYAMNYTDIKKAFIETS
ncbi:MAG: glycosyltransferase [Caulobacteraceae bacterium]